MAKDTTPSAAAKTHWLQNPNKNYLGHQDLPNGEDIILTIASAQFEEVKNPTNKSVEVKRVIRWQEPKWKPFICNETNARSIIKATATKFMEDAVGRRVQLFVSETKVAGNTMDCLRIRERAPQAQQDFSAQAAQLYNCQSLDQLRDTYLSLQPAAQAALAATKNELKKRFS